MAESFDLVVLGTGSGGGAPAARCRQAGWSVAVVDDQPYGGTCANRGCDPKKVLVGAAEVVAWQRRMLGHGVGGSATIDWRDLMRFKRTFTEPIPTSREHAFAARGITQIHGEARFIAEDRLMVGDRELQAGHIVIATGAGPRPLGIPGEEHVISSTQFLELEELPHRIAFLGAGYISLEFAHIAHQAGAQVVIFGRGRPLETFDETLVDRLLAHTRAVGIDVQLGADVTAVERIERTSSFRVGVTRDGGRSEEDVQLVVHGAGRTPNTTRLGVDAGGVRVDGQGAVVVNEYLQSVTNPRVYAAGDVTLPTGSMPLTPVAGHEGGVVASNLLDGNQKRPDYRGIPSVVFTLPPLAGVGLTEAAARARNIDIRVESGDTTTWYSSRRTREPVGMFKTIVDAHTDRVIGAHIFGDHAAEVINLFAFAVRFGITTTELKQMIYAYPTSASDLPYML